MVLSRKKLKQKIREAKAESLVLAESNKSDSRLQELVETAKQSSRLSKREKRRKKIQSLQGSDSTQKKKSDNDQENEKDEEKNEKGLVGDSQNDEENKKKKRKREDRDGGEKVNGDNGIVKKTKKAKKKKTKRKKKAENVEVKAVDEAKDAKEGTNLINGSKISEDSATKVYVGGIPYYSTEDDIRSYFESCGTITEVDCMTFPDSGKFRGIAIIGFKTEAAAKRALSLNGSDMGGFYLKIQPYKTSQTPQAKKVSDFAPKKIIEGYNRIYVGNLSWDITEEDLRTFFSGCKISSIRWGMDKETEEFRGYGHVDFSDNHSLLIALKLDQQIVCGRPIKISYAVPLKGAKSNTNSATSTAGNEADDNGLSAVSGKMRRRTCYECNQKGHVSSACPKVLAKAALGAAANDDENSARAKGAALEDTDGKTDDDVVIESSGKMRRRTCYECHQKGHVSSACPKVLAMTSSAAAAATDDDDNIVTENRAAPKDMGIGADNDGVIASSGKMRRRTCYECYQKGHISTACPNKKITETSDAS